MTASTASVLVRGTSQHADGTEIKADGLISGYSDWLVVSHLQSRTRDSLVGRVVVVDSVTVLSVLLLI